MGTVGRWAFVVIVAATVAFSSFWAFAGKDKKAHEPVQVQLKSFEVPVKGGGEEGYFTLFIEVFDQDKLWDICLREPLIRDAFLTYLMQRKLTRDSKGKLKLGKLRKRATKMTNKALRQKLAAKVYVAEGDMKVDEVRIPVPNPRNCKRVELRTKRIK